MFNTESQDNNIKNQESLGASHVPRGCNGKTGDLSTSDWASPRNKQDYSDSTAVNPRRSAPTLRAVGLTALIHPALLNPETLRLVSLAAAACLLFLIVALVQKCKQVKQPSAELVCEEVGQMTAGILDRSDRAEIKGNIESRLNEFRRQLEVTFYSASEHQLVVQEFQRVCNAIVDIDIEEESDKFFFDLNRAGELAGYFFKEYKQILPDSVRENLVSFVESLGGLQIFNHKVKLLNESKGLYKTTSSLKVWSESIAAISTCVDEYSILPLLNERLTQWLKNLMERILEATDKQISKNLQGDDSYYRKLLRESASLVLREIERDKKHESSFWNSLKHLGINTEDQIRKNQGAMDWVKSNFRQ